MKSTILKIATTAALVTSATPAFADLIYQTGIQQTGTGLGNVLTVVTVQDNSTPRNTVTQSGCVTHTAGGNPRTPTYACQEDLLGGDNTSGNAGNSTYLLTDIVGLTSAGQLGFVVNINEGGPGNSATLTDLYLSLFNTDSNELRTYSYTDLDLTLSDTGGTGQSGTHRFVLDPLQARDASGFCMDITKCIVGGGIQFAAGTTSAAAETVYVDAFRRPGDPVGEVPEPGSLALLGIGALAINSLRRRRTGAK